MLRRRQCLDEPFARSLGNSEHVVQITEGIKFPDQCQWSSSAWAIPTVKEGWRLPWIEVLRGLSICQSRERKRYIIEFNTGKLWSWSWERRKENVRKVPMSHASHPQHAFQSMLFVTVGGGRWQPKWPLFWKLSVNGCTDLGIFEREWGVGKEGAWSGGAHSFNGVHVWEQLAWLDSVFEDVSKDRKYHVFICALIDIVKLIGGHRASWIIGMSHGSRN